MDLIHAKGGVALRRDCRKPQASVRGREPPSMVVANHGLNEVNLSGKHGALEMFERSPMTPCAALKCHRYRVCTESVAKAGCFKGKGHCIYFS
jgi:hypothetical protein